MKLNLLLSENDTKNYCYIAGKWTGNRTFHTIQGILGNWCDGKQYHLCVTETPDSTFGYLSEKDQRC